MHSEVHVLERAATLLFVVVMCFCFVLSCSSCRYWKYLLGMAVTCTLLQLRAVTLEKMFAFVNNVKF